MSRTESLLCRSTGDLRRLAARNGMSPAQFDCLLCQRCPQFDRCGARDCPLDFLQGCRGPSFPDETEGCHAQLKSRRRIIAQAQAEGLRFELHYAGLTVRERQREERRERYRRQFATMPEAQRQALLRQRFARSKSHLGANPVPYPKSDTAEVSSPRTDAPATKPAEQIPHRVEVGPPVSAAGTRGSPARAGDSSTGPRQLETQSLGRN